MVTRVDVVQLLHGKLLQRFELKSTEGGPKKELNRTRIMITLAFFEEGLLIARSSTIGTQFATGEKMVTVSKEPVLCFGCDCGTEVTRTVKKVESTEWNHTDSWYFIHRYTICDIQVLLCIHVH